MEYSRVLERVEQWKGKRVGVVGDLMLDRYVWGKASRISQEAPIPVVLVKNSAVQPGGAANVLHNIVTLGAEACAFGVTGEDERAETLNALLKELSVNVDGIILDGSRVTTEKTRIIAGSQQVVRVDTEDRESIGADTANALLQRVEIAVEQGAVDALIIEDYAKGTLSRDLVSAIVARATSNKVPVALDPHPANHLDISGLTLMTPNRSEAFALAGRYLTESNGLIEEDAALLDVVRRLQEIWHVEYLLITLGVGGMALFQEGAAPLHVPTRAREVFDVSGAGDTVIAAFMLALIGGASPEEAAIISNHAAGVVVGKIGTAPGHIEELLESFRTEHYD